jgi:hypothetical protein
VQIIKVQDTTKPVLMGVPSSLVFQCLEDVPQTVADVIAMDNCDGQVVVTNSTSNSGGFANAFIPTGRLPCPYYITNMWTAFDHCTNRATAVQIITVNDTTPPVLVGVPPGMNVQCIGDVLPPTDVRALDNCDGQVTVSVTTTNSGGFADLFNPTNRLPCPLFITNTWTAMDRCSNKVSAVQIIKVQDTIKPLLMGVPSSLNFQCIEDVPQTVVDVIGMDNCDGQVLVTVSTTNSGGFANPFNPTNRLSCPFFITNTWTAVDRCTNRATAVQIITVNDTTPPQLLGVPLNMNVQCIADALPPADVRAIDNCDGQIAVTLFTTNSGGFTNVFNPANRLPCPLFITNIWTAMDQCSNKVSAVQVIKVQDTTKPEFVGVPPNATFQCLSDVPALAVVTADDNCDGFIQVTNVMSMTNTAVCPIIITNTWKVSDRCGNTNQATQVIVVRDTIPPAITCPPTNILVFRFGDVPPCPTNLAGFKAIGGNASDNCDTNLTYTCANGPTNTDGCISSFIRTHTVSDRCGNSASCLQTITIQNCPKICVIKEVACSLPGDNCGSFSDVATGFTSSNQIPAFCYRITVTNCGTVALTNISVMDNRLGNLTNFFTPFSNQLPVGGTFTKIFRMAWPTNTINTVTAIGTSAIDGRSVTNTDSAMAVVLPASLSCSSVITSLDDVDSNPSDNQVILLGNGPHTVSLSITIRNTGAADLAGVTISAPALSQLGCLVPGTFNLPAGASANFPCTASVNCGSFPNLLTIPISVTAVVDTRGGQCGFDTNGNNITVTSTNADMCQLLLQCVPPCPTNCGAMSQCTPPYPTNNLALFGTNNVRTSLDFSESEVLRAFTNTLVNGCVPSQIRVFYNDEHALILGVRQIIVKNAAGAGGTITSNYTVTPLSSSPSNTFNPKVGATDLTGNQRGTDVSDRPLFPALFITDLTTSTNPLAGDWQFGGRPIPPHAIFGTWKSAVRTLDNTRNPPVATVTPDADPAKNNYILGAGSDPVPPGLVNQGYGTELRWNIDETNMVDQAGQPLLPGHTYRLYFMVHDGDQNKQGGDAGQGCAVLVMGGQTNCGIGAIGDFVWKDTNTNGLQDANEPGVQGATVKLLDCNTMNVLRTTTTDSNGHYLFTSLAPGKYKVQFTPPAGFGFTIPNANGNSMDAKDSDADVVTGLTGCYTIGINQTNLTVDAGLVMLPPPQLQLIKSANPTLTLPGGSVTYSYAVTNNGTTALTDLVVTDDNGTPGFTGDDFVAGTVATLAPGTGTVFTQTKIVPQRMCMTVDGTNLVIGTLATEILANGDVKVTYLQSRDVVDNAYGTGSAAAGWTRTHTFQNLLGSDKAEFRFVNRNGAVVLDFFADYITASAGYPSGFGTLGVNGGEGDIITGNAADVLSVTTTISDTLNQSPAFYGFTVNSPTPEAAFPAWDFVDGYTVIVRGSAFGPSGFGGVSVPLVHNSPSKLGFNAQIPVPCAACLTNTARATANAGNLPVTAIDDAFVCIELPPRLSATVNGETLTLAWDEASTGYRLQCAGTCSPSGAWTDMPNAPVIVNGQKTVQVPMSDRRQFYRLKKD